MTVEIKVHRGTDAIGGSCIEVISDVGRIILDLGSPLMENGGGDIDANRQANPTVENGMIPDVAGLIDGDCVKPILGVFLSHAHPDHYGMLEFVHDSIPIYMSEESKALIGVGNIFYPKELTLPQTLDRCITFQQGISFSIGAFTITPYLMDHSAFGASSLLIEVEGKRILYTGDMRAHGRKGKLFWALAHKVAHIDCMLMEGTTLGGKHHDGFNDEVAVEEGMVKSFDHNHATFVLGSGSNVDWLVSLYRAAKRTGKILVLDLYQFYLLTRLKKFSASLPPHDGDHIRVFYTQYQASKLEEHDLVDVMTKEAIRRKISRDEIWASPDKMVVRLSMGEMKRLANNMANKNKLHFVYSMWQGYLERDRNMAAFPKQYGCEWQSIHTSGHAWLEDLQKLTEIIKPDMLVPIHTLQGDEFAKHFDNVVRIKDGEDLIVGDIIRERLTKMATWAEIRRVNTTDIAHYEYAYVRIGGNGFRAVSVAPDFPLSGYARSTVKEWEAVLKHFESNKNLKENVHPVPEKRLQAFMIRSALKDSLSLKKLIGTQLKDEEFDDILFAFDEISLGDRDNKITFTKNFDKKTEGVIRCDLLCVGVKGDEGFPILMELKYDRKLNRLVEQLSEFSEQIKRNYQAEFKLLLESATGLKVDCSKVYQVMIWPSSPSGKEAPKTIKKLKESNISVFEYFPEEIDGKLNKAHFKLKDYG